MFLKTGFVYYVKDGNKLHKAYLPAGEHPDPIGCTFVEVGSKEELDAIVLDKSDAQIAYEQKQLFRNSAINKLKALGFSEEEISFII